jgi:hypothetical protein
MYIQHVLLCPTYDDLIYGSKVLAATMIHLKPMGLAMLSIYQSPYRWNGISQQNKIKLQLLL